MYLWMSKTDTLQLRQKYQYLYPIINISNISLSTLQNIEKEDRNDACHILALCIR